MQRFDSFDYSEIHTITSQTWLPYPSPPTSSTEVGAPPPSTLRKSSPTTQRRDKKILFVLWGGIFTYITIFEY
jgi:hypothetical protein